MYTKYCYSDIIPADVDGCECIVELVLDDVLLVLVTEEGGMVVDDSALGMGGVCGERWSSAMGAKWVWSEFVVT